jgi:D-aminopeptidase
VVIRARDLGIPFKGETGSWNAITDVAGVEVGHVTLISGEGPLIRGKGPVRTGVSAILPRGKQFRPCFCAWYALNGNGELTGTAWIEESGCMTTPIMLTNTHSVGIVHDAVIDWKLHNKFYPQSKDDSFWSLPVVGETFDGVLNDINGFHVTAQHAHQALNNARSGPVEEGSVGGGTGMITHDFKGGVGTSSRRIVLGEKLEYSVGVYVQSNYGIREHLTIAGVPVGAELTDQMPSYNKNGTRDETGSIIVVVATDAPLLPHQLKRMAARVPAGLSKVGGHGANSSGDIFLAFSTANENAFNPTAIENVNMLPNEFMNRLFDGVVFATEEAIINAMVAAQTMTGIDGKTVYRLPHSRLQKVLKKYNRLHNVI